MRRSSRRDWLRNTGSAALSLPLLTESIAPRGRAQTVAGCATNNSCVATAANGEAIPGWTQPVYSSTTTTTDGKVVFVPEGMVYVPAGSFIMGVQNGESYKVNADGSVSSSTADTRHSVTLSGYCISKYPITNAQYKAFVDEMGSSYKPVGPSSGSAKCYWDNPEFNWATRGNHPVLWVSYNNAVAYCAWVAKKTGWSVSLPSEAQWERAARGKTTTGSEYLYPWGNSTSPTDYQTHLNYNALVSIATGTSRTVNGKVYPTWPYVVSTSSSSASVSNFKAIAHGYDDTTTADIDEGSAEVQSVWTSMMNPGGYTTPVASYPASPDGAYDMSGNVFEFTRDYFTISYWIDLAKSTSDPCVEDVSVLTGADKKSGSDGTISNTSGTATKIVRGGSWYANENSCLTHHRTETRAAGAGAYHSVGFRIVMTPPVAAAAVPVVAAGGVVNSASGAAGVSPGAWITIYGSSLAPVTQTVASADLANGYLPTSLGGITVQINGKPAFVYYVSPTQVNVEAPADSSTGPVSVTVTNSAGTSAPISATEQAILPGLFTAANYVLAVRPQDGAIIMGSGTTPSARQGDILELFGTGFGPTQNSTAPGLVFSGADATRTLASVTIGGQSAAVSWSGLVSAGFYQINVTVPSGLADGEYPVVATMVGVSTPTTARLKVQSN